MTDVTDGSSRVSDGRDRRWDAHRHERREHLLSVAVDLVDREGGDVQISVIASEAGMPRSLVYKLFKDRGDLDDQIRLRIVDDLSTALLASLASTGTIRSMARQGVAYYVGWLGAHPNLRLFLSAGSSSLPVRDGSAIAGGKSAFARNVQVLVETLAPQFLGRPAPRGAAQNLAYGLVGLFDNTIVRWLVAGESRSSEEELIAFVSDAACGVIEVAARRLGGEVDVDAPLDL